MDPMEGLSYLSKIPGCGGWRGDRPEDFQVDEIIQGKRASEIRVENEGGFGEYTRFVLTKRGVTTEDALAIIAKRLKTNRERFSVAGQKDRNAVTFQLASCWNGSKNEKDANITATKLAGAELPKEIRISSPFYSDDKVRTGDLAGNHFQIRLDGAKKEGQISRIMEDTRGLVPNYFGPQRFGMKQNNTTVAKYMLLKQYKGAVCAFLAGSEDDFSRLNDDGISEAYLAGLRKGSYEWLVGRYLVEHEGEYLNAVRKIPRAIKKLIVQSYQSYLFNLELSERIKRKQLQPLDGEKTCGFNSCGFIDPEKPGNAATVGIMVGYGTGANGIMSDILWKEGIELGDFKFRDMPELASEGFERPFLVNVKDLKVERESATRAIAVSFALGKGAYATSFLREITSLKKNSGSE